MATETRVERRRRRKGEVLRTIEEAGLGGILTGEYREDPWGYAGMPVSLRTERIGVPDADTITTLGVLRSARGVIATGDRMALWRLAELFRFAVTEV